MPSARLVIAALIVVTARLSGATIATAQTPDEVDDSTRPVAPPRIEIGGTAGLAIVIPEYGLIASVPIEKDSAIEVIATRMPAFFDAPPHLVAQVQVRVPFRSDLRSRKSLLVGLTGITADNGEPFLELDPGTFVRPHAGVSLQWPVAPTLDFRFDAQGIFTFIGELPILPRVMTALVWHPRDAATRANSRRTSR